MIKRTVLNLVLAALIALAALPTSSVSADSLVLSPSSKPYGMTFGQWSQAWWQWALAIPVHNPKLSRTVYHPLVDLSGQQCGNGQSGSVWFLGGVFSQSGAPAQSTVVRNECAVPANTALFVPILNSECSLIEAQFGCGDGTPEGLRAAVKSVMDRASHLSIDVDGTNIDIGSANRVGDPKKPLFSFTLPRDNILNFIGEGPYKAGTYYPAVDDGYYVMLAPLPAGAHTIHFHGEIPVYNFSLDVTYNLTVK